MFEILARDAAGRLGRLKTPHGQILTPTILPVFNPNIPLIPATELEIEFKIPILITNAYIIYRTPKLREKASQGVHNLIGFHKAIMTDSGAYQAWIYKKDLDVTNRDIIQFEEVLEPDIATILDVFTETDDYNVARAGVEKTIKAAEECVKIREKEKIMWAAPIQGGQFLDLLAYCAKKMSDLDFAIHPLGTLAPALQSYNFRQVAETIIITKQNLIPSRPLHGFSIGHPIFFALAVAFGADLFDSSAYALFARDKRYLTLNGTLRFEKLEEFPCVCPVCTKFTPQELKELPNSQIEYLIAKHNLYVTLGEIKQIHVAIRENWLWELVQERIRAHPNLLDAFIYNLSKYSELFLKFDPISKKSGFFYSGSESLLRPEVIRYEKKILEMYNPPSQATILLLIPDLDVRFSNAPQFQKWFTFIDELSYRTNIHVCFYSPIFGIIPEELKDIYPLSQHEYPKTYDAQLNSHAKNIFLKYLQKHQNQYKKIWIYRPKRYFNAKNQEQDLVSHPIDEILDPKFDIFHSIEHLKKELD